MKADEIVTLTREGIASLLRSRTGMAPDQSPGHEKRRSPRWPFPGTVEITPPEGHADTPFFGAVRNLSETGLGMQCDRYFDINTRLEVAVHLPEASFCGHAYVRYCMETPQGYMTGLEFDFSPPGSPVSL